MLHVIVCFIYSPSSRRCCLLFFSAKLGGLEKDHTRRVLLSTENKTEFMGV